MSICPHPEKARYSTAPEAARAVLAHPACRSYYLCACGVYHMTSRPVVAISVASPTGSSPADIIPNEHGLPPERNFVGMLVMNYRVLGRVKDEHGYYSWLCKCEFCGRLVNRSGTKLTRALRLRRMNPRFNRPCKVCRGEITPEQYDQLVTAALERRAKRERKSA